MPEYPITELPTTRVPDRPLDPPAVLAEIREDRPIAPIVYPDGHEGWFVTSHELGRAVLGHPGFSARHELQHLPFPGVGQLPPAAIGELGATDPPDHTRYRKLLAGKFTARRMQLLTERVQEFTTDHLDAMVRQGPPAELMSAFARPIPTLMICELLGVPYEDRETFQGYIEGMLWREGMTPEDQGNAWMATQQYLVDLVKAKRVDPTDDVLSDMTSSDLTDEELTGIGTYMLGAGLHTTSTIIGMGTFALLLNPSQLQSLRDNPDLTDNAIEEILRYVGIGPCSLRTALVDTEIDGVPVAAGQTITVSLDGANRDPKRYPDPDTLDIRRNATGHLTFLHGIHQCLGQHLARTELRVSLPALLTRFPTLRLAVPATEIPLRTDHSLYEIDKLPLTWDV